MTQTQYGLSERIDSLNSDLKREYCERFTLFKKDVLDYAYNHLTINRIAELGCVWGVDGAYGRYISDKYSTEEIIMVDLIWNETALNLCNSKPGIKTIEGNFGDKDMPEKIGKVDAVILYDILLHLVNPDWDFLLKMYSEYTNAFIIVNPQFTGSSTTVRLLDLGDDLYFKNIPHQPDHPTYKKVFSNPYEFDPIQKKILRDAFFIWQWGITNYDLIAKMDRLGFEPIFIQKDNLLYFDLKNFVNYGFVFSKRHLNMK
jgi:hypothetical protein